MKNPSGNISGWQLLFYLTTLLMVLAQAVNFVFIIAALFYQSKPLSLPFSFFSWLGYTASILFLYLQIILVTRKPYASSLKTIKRNLGFILILGILFTGFQILNHDQWLSQNKEYEDFIKNIFRAIIWPAVWLGYFQRSKRATLFYSQ